TGSEDCNGDGLIDVGDVICARNMACEAGQNQPPVIAAIADQSLTAGESFSLQVQASDPDPGDTLSYTLTTAPAGMLVDGNGLITWTPSSGDLGAHPVTVEVADPPGLSASASFTLTVVLPEQNNARPVLEGIADRRVPVGTLVVINPTASDPDAGDTLGFTLHDAPAGMTIEAVSGQIRWTPDSNQIGAFLVGVEVSDADGLADRRLFRITVIDGGPPVLDAIADQGARADVPFSLTVTATDSDAGDSLAFSLDQSPVGMSLNPDSGDLDWTPAPAQLGNHSVGVTVTDSSGLSDSATFSIAVGQARPPVAVDDAYQAVKGDTLTVVAPGVLANDSDPNNDPLTAVLETGPAKGTLTLNADGGFDYTPDNPAGTLAIVEKFRLTGAGASLAQPLIMDMDGDGVPDIIYHHYGKLGALRGDTMSKVFEVSIDRSLWGEKAIADIDLDGHPDMVLIGQEDGHASTQGGRKLIALEHDGQVKWISESLPDYYDREGQRVGRPSFSYAKVSIADLDQDGTPEIVVGWGQQGVFGGVGYSVFDNQGLLLDSAQAEGIPSTQAHGRTEIVDLDLDGKPEILTGSAAFRHDGELLWARSDVTQNNKSVYTPIAANLDDDPYPELVRRTYIGSGAHSILAWNHDGTDLWQTTVPHLGSNEPLVL
ncbi:MAG TPA: putative Ig domain-containing protein, partial [Wenzhouxiangella sp.]|nr:putative Ig domain-containing protein [Wenzhouxiangella sp.]